jgi:hypothetical protein
VHEYVYENVFEHEHEHEHEYEYVSLRLAIQSVWDLALLRRFADAAPSVLTMARVVRRAWCDGGGSAAVGDR